MVADVLETQKVTKRAASKGAAPRRSPASRKKRDAKLDAQYRVVAVLQVQDKSGVINGARGDGVVMTGHRLLALVGEHPDSLLAKDYIEPFHAVDQ